MIAPRRFAARSLRRRFAVIGFLAVFVPVLILLAVALTTTEVEVEPAPSGEGVEIAAETRLSVLVPLTALLLAGPLALVVSAWASRSVRPLVTMTEALAQIEAGSLDRRIEMRNAPGEVHALAEAFDRVLDRLEVSTESQRRLLEDTGHQLRTPLTTASVAIDALVARSTATDADVARARRALDRLGQTIDELLAEARDRSRLVAQVDNDLVALARRAVDDRAVDRSVEVRLTGPARCLAAADGPAVERALANLVDNAVRASPPGGRVDVVVGEADGRAFIAVEDDGPGIAADELPRLFERYWRSGTDGGDGHGIGLALVAQVAAGHEGVDCRSPAGDRSTRFTLWFSR